MNTIIASPFEIVALQALQLSQSSALTRWLTSTFIQPLYIYHPAARQAAVAGVLSVVLAGGIAAVIAFLFKLWRDRIALGRGAAELPLGPRRSLVALVLWLFVFMLCYVVGFITLAPNPARLIGAANMMTLVFLGTVIYVGVFLLLHLPVHRKHLPWRGVQ